MIWFATWCVAFFLGGWFYWFIQRPKRLAIRNELGDVKVDVTKAVSDLMDENTALKNHNAQLLEMVQKLESAIEARNKEELRAVSNLNKASEVMTQLQRQYIQLETQLRDLINTK